MKTYPGRVLGFALLAGLAVSAIGCDDFLDVKNPNNLEAEAIDPESDARLLSQSVWQRFTSDFWGYSEQPLNVYVAWYTGSAWVGDTYPTRNDFGRRDVPWNNGHANSIWNYIHRNLNFARTTVAAIEDAGNTVDLAQAHFVSAFSLLIQAESFCEGTIADHSVTPPEPRGPMSPVMLLDSAIVDFGNVKTVAQGVTGSDAERASALATAAQVGIARAHLQAGRRSEASAAAAQVPGDFEFLVWHMDDSSNRSLGNAVWAYSEARISLVTPPAFRAMADAGDPRIAYVDVGRVAQDGTLWFYRQDKYQGWGDHERIVSGLEARYIKIEADQDAAAMLAFINERRAVGNQGPLEPTSDMSVLMTELMDQKTRDFWLEGKRLADFRRNPQFMSHIIPSGTDTYYKPDLGVVNDETCWPVHRSEYLNNPFFEM